MKRSKPAFPGSRSSASVSSAIEARCVARATQVPTSPRASAMGFPICRVMSRATSSRRAVSASPKRRTSAARSVTGTRAQARWAAAARSTAAIASASVASGSSHATSPVNGSSTRRVRVRSVMAGRITPGPALSRSLSEYIAPMKFFATCAKGTEGALRRELAALKLRHVRGDRGGVAFEGELEAGMRACLHGRVAIRVLLELASFPAGDADALYEGVRAVDWSPWLTARTTLAVEATVRDSALTHSMFVAQKVKDAVVDALRERLGARPDVDPKDPDIRIVLHLARDHADLALDLAGEPLH